MKEMNIKTWIEKFNNGEFEDNNINIQIDAGWYDWFCRDSSLKNKTKSIGNIIKDLQDSSRVNLEDMYIFFKNNCRMSSGLYDSFKICNINTRDVIYCININEPNCLKYVIYGIDNNFEEPLLETKYKKELINWLNK